jgi:hypothetical protein
LCLKQGGNININRGGLGPELDNKGEGIEFICKYRVFLKDTQQEADRYMGQAFYTY